MVKSFVSASSSNINFSGSFSLAVPVSPASSSETTAILFSLNAVYKSSNESASKSNPFNAFAIVS